MGIFPNRRSQDARSMNLLLYRFLVLLAMLVISPGCQRSDKLLEKIESPSKLINESNLRRDSQSLSAVRQELDLSKEIPVSHEVLKTWVPERVGEFQRTQLLSGHRADAGIVAIQASYQHPTLPNQTIQLEILDGAGKNGSLLVQAASERLKLDIVESKNGVRSHIYSRGELRVRETEIAEQNYTEVEFIDQNRFHYTLKGFRLSLDQLWSFCTSANFISH